ncbi:MAG: hypothetical protein AMS16_00665 [Planctomycetes bacterium DG_58]|nr:MAG: hypothetical protein AMS16_00665 [Planctomycetes bacterium DG_58]KPL04891.1 MAG: hypothetical protein AMK75_00220 [Planctomycetes bacterium SM23_65]
MAQPFNFGIADHVLAELSGVTHYALHTDVGAMIAAADAARGLAERLGVDPPRPHLAGLGYVHVSTLGAKVELAPELMEPIVHPCIRTPRDIDRLAEPEDYLTTPLVRQRLALAAELKSRRDDAIERIGHNYEGPVTTAALLMGQDFFTLPWDDPARAHKLMAFVTQSMIHYTRILAEHQGRALSGWVSNPDDFAGMFPPSIFREFVLPYWQKLYEGLEATHRGLHSELLREEHLPFLEEAKIDTFDPSVDPHLPPEVLARSCKVPYGLRIWPSQLMSMSTDDLVKLYRYYADFGTPYITFSMGRLDEEAKIGALLAVARELASAT